MRRSYLSLVLVAMASFVAWAGDSTVKGIPNFHKVNDHVYRGGQPADEGWKSLAALGVKTVIDLRLVDEHPTRLEAQAVESAGMRYINIPMHGVVAPSSEQVAKALALLNSDNAVFVHCRRGADRTGTIIACYRMTHDGWDNERALKEAKLYGMSWLQLGMKRYVMDFHAPVDVATTPDLTPAPAAGRP